MNVTYWAQDLAQSEKFDDYCYYYYPLSLAALLYIQDKSPLQCDAGKNHPLFLQVNIL